jgi:uncharacterized protein GlcG (DUF336 family)
LTEITLHQARAIAEAAHREASGRGLAAMSVVVTDVSGAIRIAERTDGAPPFGISIAQAKARTALGFRRSSIKTAAVFQGQPAVTTGLSEATGGQFLPLGGGVVVLGPDGGAIGAAGVAGGMPEIDDAVISAAVASAGLTVKE